MILLLAVGAGIVIGLVLPGLIRFIKTWLPDADDYMQMSDERRARIIEESEDAIH